MSDIIIESTVNGVSVSDNSTSVEVSEQNVSINAEVAEHSILVTPAVNQITVGEFGIISPNHSAPTFGFEYYKDNEFTLENPLIADGGKVQYQNNGLGATTELRFQPSTGPMWNTFSNRINSDKVGNTFQIRVDWKARSNKQNAYYTIKFDIGDGSEIIILEKTWLMLKGINVEENFSETFGIFSLETFVANGCKIIFDSTTDGSRISLYDFGLKIEKIFTPQ